MLKIYVDIVVIIVNIVIFTVIAVIMWIHPVKLQSLHIQQNHNFWLYIQAVPHKVCQTSDCLSEMPSLKCVIPTYVQ
jgi:hypothetical protein